MLDSTLRSALLERRVTVGSWIQVGHPAVAEVLARAGFDWLGVDCEHTDIGLHEFSAIARALHGRGPAPLARVEKNDPLAIRRVLDMGAAGVIVPLVNSADDAKRAVRAAKFAPEGERGFAFCRANEWGAEFDSYTGAANDRTAVIAMIETAQAVENAEEILSVEGIDGTLIGPYDMSGSLGVPGHTEDPRVKEGGRQVVEACRRCGKSAGIHVVLPDRERIREVVEQGFTFIAVGMDTVFLDEGAGAALQMVRDVQ